VAVRLSDDGGNWAGSVYISFSSPVKYQLWGCMSYTSFPTTPPTETEKIWRIAYTQSQTSQQIEIFCNDVKVLELLLSDDVCDDSDWRDYWERDVKKITFYYSDTASDKYCTVNRGSYKEPLTRQL